MCRHFQCVLLIKQSKSLANIVDDSLKETTPKCKPRMHVSHQELMHFQEETLYLAVHLLNRSLRQVKVTTATLQLLGIVCLFLAAKKEECLLPEVCFLGPPPILAGLFERDHVPLPPFLRCLDCAT